MRKFIALTPPQITFIRMAVNHVIEFGEDTGQSRQARAAELRVADGISHATARPVPFNKLVAAAKHALRTLEICRNDLNASGDGGGGSDGEVCEEAKALTPAIKKLRAALAKIEGREL